MGSFKRDMARLFNLLEADALASLSDLLRYQFIANMYNKMRTNILLPTSASAASARESSPKYNTMNGKHDRPGAKEGNSIITVRFLAPAFFGKVIFSKYFEQASMIILNAKASRGGKISKELSSLILSRATKMTAGRAMLRIMVLTPP